MELLVDGISVNAPEGGSILEACDLAGRYVPRLCFHPGVGCACELGVECGLCVVDVDADGTGEPRGAGFVLEQPADGEDRRSARLLACCTAARPGMSVTTDGPALRALRLARLASIIERHPHICLTCPDADGCNREECTYGVPTEARCCAEFGRCELGEVLAYVDPQTELPRRAVVVSRVSREEGRIRLEPGLCIGCGRCVRVCASSPMAGNALKLEQDDGPEEEPRWVAVPKAESLRASGCTFCGQCVLVCPAGAMTTCGAAGARWLEQRRGRAGLPLPVLPPVTGWRALDEAQRAMVPAVPGVFLLADASGGVLRISGVADLAAGLAAALADPPCRSADRFRFEEAELFTQRESELLARFTQQHGHLPAANDLGDELFEDDLCEDDLGEADPSEGDMFGDGLPDGDRE